MSTLIYFAIPAFVILLGIEAALSRRADVRGYAGRDTVASLSMGIGNLVLSIAAKVYAVGLYSLMNQFAIFEVSTDSGLAWALVLVGDDFCYYWFHRVHHEVRLFWAAHVNHHSSRFYNLSTALRQSWTTPLTSPLFWAPLALLGFPPLMILSAQAISLLYQFWIHTELIGKLGPLERALNTPSHHRVHHGRNPQYLDRNYGGILIIWDRLFGTFEPEDAPVDYGLTTNIDSYNPVVIAFHEWRAMLQSARKARGWREALRYLTAPPGWSPHGSSMTSRELRGLRSS